VRGARHNNLRNIARSAGSVTGQWLADHLSVLIALPTIGRDFLTSLAARQWVMNGYTLTLAAFLLIGGRSATGSAGGRST
jgi:hypothetical protein